MEPTPLAEQFRFWSSNFAAARPPSKNMTRRRTAWDIFLRWLERQDERVDTWQEAMERFVRYWAGSKPQVLFDVLWLLQRQLDNRSAFSGCVWKPALELIANEKFNRYQTQY